MPPIEIPAHCRVHLQGELEVPSSAGGQPCGFDEVKQRLKKDATMSNTSRHDWICKRAYAIWEAEGRPNGRDAEHWLQATAERDRLERTRASTDGNEVLVKFRPKAPEPRKPAAQIAERHKLPRAV
ncbi:hypothetical protein FHX06_000636 [Rhizobium sp. BK512]|jgi:hypothetical protein|nr:hypothetical protein [Rhizobium sp. BK512]